MFSETSRMESPNEKEDSNISRRRSQSDGCAPIWTLPAELLLHLLKGLQFRDLLNLRSVKSYLSFKKIIK